MLLIETTSVFSPADGSAPRTITIRVSDLQQDPKHSCWSVAVDVMGFKTDDHVRIRGVDWANAIEGAAIFLRGLVGGRVREDGGTITPSLDPMWQTVNPVETPDGSTDGAGGAGGSP